MAKKAVKTQGEETVEETPFSIVETHNEEYLDLKFIENERKDKGHEGEKQMQAWIKGSDNRLPTMFAIDNSYDGPIVVESGKTYRCRITKMIGSGKIFSRVAVEPLFEIPSIGDEVEGSFVWNETKAQWSFVEKDQEGRTFLFFPDRSNEKTPYDLSRVPAWQRVGLRPRWRCKIMIRCFKSDGGVNQRFFPYSVELIEEVLSERARRRKENHG